MENNKNTNTFHIRFDNVRNDELIFTATLTPAYLLSTEYATDNSDQFNDDHDDISDYDPHAPYIEYEFNIAPRHGDSIYFNIKNDSGDIIESSDEFIYGFGNEIYEFIKTAAAHYELPLYENE